MMLAGPTLRVALAATHLPLSAVPKAVTRATVEAVIRTVDRDLRSRFRISAPRIRVAGLNPHAGEAGHLGTEDMTEIQPAIEACQRDGLNVTGPYPADTLFNASLREQTDAFVAMYHDQGLPVVKALDFGDVVNVTLGLQDAGLTLASFRTGGATSHFQKEQNLGALQFHGRWRTPVTLQHYLQEALSAYLLLELPSATRAAVAACQAAFVKMTSPPSFGPG